MENYGFCISLGVFSDKNLQTLIGKIFKELGVGEGFVDPNFNTKVSCFVETSINNFNTFSIGNQLPEWQRTKLPKGTKIGTKTQIVFKTRSDLYRAENGVLTFEDAEWGFYEDYAKVAETMSQLPLYKIVPNIPGTKYRPLITRNKPELSITLKLLSLGNIQNLLELINLGFIEVYRAILPEGGKGKWIKLSNQEVILEVYS